MTKARNNADNVSGDISEVTAGTGISVSNGTGPAPAVALTTPVASTNGGTGLSSFTTGDIIYSSSGNTLSKLGIGTTSQVLTVAGGVPSWAAASSGGMTLLATLSLSGSSTASGTISSAYTQFKIYIKNAKFASGINSFQLRLNGDTGSNYSYQTFLSKNTSELSSAYSSSDTKFNIGQSETTLADCRMFGALINITRPSDTDRVFINSQSIGFDGGNTFQNLSAGVYDNSAAITSITFIAGGSTFSGDVYIYGVN